MVENFFLDNPDLQFQLDKVDLKEIVDLKEEGYRYFGDYPAAPRNYADAKDTIACCWKCWAKSALR